MSNETVHYSTQGLSGAASQVASRLRLSHSGVMWWHLRREMSGHRSQWVTVWHRSLWLQPSGACNRYSATLTSRINVMSSQMHPRRAAELWEWRSTLTPFGKEIFPSWWLGHTAALADWHEWLTVSLWSHDPRYTAQLVLHILNIVVTLCPLKTNTTLYSSAALFPY